MKTTDSNLLKREIRLTAFLQHYGMTTVNFFASTLNCCFVMLVYSAINLIGGSAGATPPEIILAPLSPPHFSRRVKNFEFRLYCLLKMFANEKDIQGMNMILLDCYCALTYAKCCSSFLCVFWLCM